MTNVPISAPVESSPATPTPVPIYTKEDMDRARQETAAQSFHAGYGKGKQEVAQAAPVQPTETSQGAFNQPIQPQAQPAINPEMQQLIDQRLQQQLAQQQQQFHEQQQIRATQEAAARLDSQLLQNKDKYPDLDSVLPAADFKKFHNVIGLASDNAISNGDAVIYHLAQNPLKKAQLHDLAIRDPMGAILETRRLAESLKQNDAAANMPTTKEPLSQLTPSSVGVSRSGPKTLKDYKREYRF